MWSPAAARPVRRWGHGRQRGSVSVEIAVLTPAFLLLIVLAIVAGRTALAQHATELAAHDAARAASLSRDAAGAYEAATAAVSDQPGLTAMCGNDVAADLVVDVSGFDRPADPSAPAYVAVTVRCVVVFTDLTLPGVPAYREVSATFLSAVDVFRGRSP